MEAGLLVFCRDGDRVDGVALLAIAVDLLESTGSPSLFSPLPEMSITFLSAFPGNWSRSKAATSMAEETEVPALPHA